MNPGNHQDLGYSKTEVLLETFIWQVEKFMYSMIAILGRNCEIFWMDTEWLLSFAVIFGSKPLLHFKEIVNNYPKYNLARY